MVSVKPLGQVASHDNGMSPFEGLGESSDESDMKSCSKTDGTA